MESAKDLHKMQAPAKLRNKLGFTLELMANYLNLHISTLKMAERGARVIPADALLKMARLEIKLAADAAANKQQPAHPAETNEAEELKRRYFEMSKLENKYSCEQWRLMVKLKQAEKSYPRIGVRLQMIDHILNENEKGEYDRDYWQKHRRINLQLLKKYCLPIQLYCKIMIDFLGAQTELCKQTKSRLREAFPAVLATNNIEW